MSNLQPEADPQQSVADRLAEVLLLEAVFGKDRLRASTAIIDRLEGKPRQAPDAEQAGRPEVVVIE